MSQNPVTRLYGPKTTKASDTLFERMGGEKKLDEVVTGVYNDMKGDKEIGKQFARFRLERLKDRTVDYLRGEWGGEAYKGSDLWISHSHMGINSHWYDIMMKYYVSRLKKARIGKKEQQEILDSLEKMRKPVVDPGLKLKDMYLRHSEREAAKAGGDGWGHVSNDPKERAKKEKETLDMLARGNANMEEPKIEKAAEPTTAPAKPAGQAPAPKKAAGAKARKTQEPPADPAAVPPEATKSAIARGVSEASTRSPESDDAVVEEAAVAKSAPPKKAGKAKKKQPAATTLYNFWTEVDSPPMQVPSSQPSGAELLYRFSVGCV